MAVAERDRHGHLQRRRRGARRPQRRSQHDARGGGLGFDVECADFGTTFDVTSVIAANTPWGRVGKGVRGIRAIKGAKGAKGAVPAVARTQPQNLAEKLALDEAMGGAGTRIMKGKINDPRYPEDVWAKMQHVHENPGGTKTVIHYWENLDGCSRRVEVQVTCTPLEVLGSKMLLGLVRPGAIPDAATDALGTRL